MKKIILSAMLLLGFGMLMSCNSDRDSNPTIANPTTFVLNTPSYAGLLTDLETSDSLAFTWSQANYGGFPVAAQYKFQVSATGNFTQEYDDNADDNTGADYVTLSETYTSCTGNVSAEDIDAAIEKLLGWTSEGDVTSPLTAYLRATSQVLGTTYASTLIASNVVSIKVDPYYIELKAADPEIWYLVGACVGDGTWTNSKRSDIGVSLIPMQEVAGESYDAKTGQGLIQWIGYLNTDGFKLIKTPGSWDDQWGMSDGAFVKNDGGSGNIAVSAAGYYKVQLNTATDELTIDAYDDTPTIYSKLTMTGEYDSWACVDDLNAVNTYSGAINHDWYCDFTAPSGGTEVKFLANGSWDVNWGSTDFPYGWGTQNGKNIPATEGSYRVIFNDITGYYKFISE